jgi:hypothetical protein
MISILNESGLLKIPIFKVNLAQELDTKINGLHKCLSFKASGTEACHLDDKIQWVLSYKELMFEQQKIK